MSASSASVIVCHDVARGGCAAEMRYLLPPEVSPLRNSATSASAIAYAQVRAHSRSYSPACRYIKALHYSHGSATITPDSERPSDGLSAHREPRLAGVVLGPGHAEASSDPRRQDVGGSDRARSESAWRLRRGGGACTDLQPGLPVLH